MEQSRPEGAPSHISRSESLPFSDTVEPQLKHFTVAAAVTVTTVGALVLAGWAFEVGALKSVLPGLSSMKANTALGLVLAGVALWLWADEYAPPRQRRAGLVCAGLVTLIGLLTLSQYVFGIDFGIDQWLFRDVSATVTTSHPGRMGINTALVFVLLGGALMLLDARTQGGAWGGQAATLGGLLVALAALVGYGYGVAYLTRFSSATQMALHTALSFVALALGLLAARPRRPLMALLTSRGPGGALARRIWPQAILLLLVLGWLRLAGQRAGLYEYAFGTGLHVIAGIILFSLLIWRAAHQVERLNAKRLEAEDAERKAESALWRSEHNLADFFENASVGLHWVGPDGTILRANQTELKLLGYRHEEYVGHNIAKFHADPPVIADILTRLTRGETLQEYPARLCCKDGSIRDVLINSNVLFENGEFLHTRCFTRDITEHKQAEEQLRWSEEKFRSLVAATAQITWTNSAEGKMLGGQEQWSAFTGQRFEEYQGYGWAEALHPDDRASTIERWQQSVAIRSLFEVEHRVRRHDGEYCHCLVRAVPVLNANGEIREWVGIHTDISEEKRLLAAERKARELAEAANRLKDEFLATVSHELRTPLNHMLGWVVMLRAGSLPPDKAAEALATIERNVRAQNRLVEDLLDVSRIVTGKMQLHVQSVAMAQVIEAAIASARPAAEARGIRLQVVLDSQVSTVSGDADRLQQIVWNLISNAIKFTPKGGRVQVRLERLDSHVAITVSDTGDGLAPEFLPYVFDRFSQADPSIKRKQGGLGLGLAIVRHLVELHGGEVSVASEGLGEGTTFTVTLPLRIADHGWKAAEAATAAYAQQVQSARHPAQPALLKGVRVLVVDDEADSRMLVAVLLTGSQAEVRTAGSLAEALTILDDWRPDALISDIGMPGGDGYELIRAVRQRELATGHRLPAVALTAYARSEDRLRAIAAGFQMHVAKPVEPEELITVIASLTGRL